MGPKSGGTEVEIQGLGFQQAAVCNLTVSFGPYYAKPKEVTKHSITVKAPPAAVADGSMVTFSLNGQQFIKD